MKLRPPILCKFLPDAGNKRRNSEAPCLAVEEIRGQFDRRQERWAPLVGRAAAAAGEAPGRRHHPGPPARQPACSAIDPACRSASCPRTKSAVLNGLSQKIEIC